MCYYFFPLIDAFRVISRCSVTGQWRVLKSVGACEYRSFNFRLSEYNYVNWECTSVLAR